MKHTQIIMLFDRATWSPKESNFPGAVLHRGFAMSPASPAHAAPYPGHKSKDLTYPVNNQPGLTDAEDAEDMSSALELEPTSKV